MWITFFCTVNFLHFLAEPVKSSFEIQIFFSSLSLPLLKKNSNLINFPIESRGRQNWSTAAFFHFNVGLISPLVCTLFCIKHRAFHTGSNVICVNVEAWRSSSNGLNDWPKKNKQNEQWNRRRTAVRGNFIYCNCSKSKAHDVFFQVHKRKKRRRPTAEVETWKIVWAVLDVQTFLFILLSNCFQHFLFFFIICRRSHDSGVKALSLPLSLAPPVDSLMLCQT